MQPDNQELAMKRIPTGSPVAILLSLIVMLLSVAAHGEELVDASADYDTNNVFARILRGELPADIVFESEYALAFHDIRPKARVHVLVIPKGPYTNILQFNQNASSEEKLGLLDAISQTARIMGVDESGFRLVCNTGHDGGQTVPHLHFHLIGGEHLR
jgi:diadenosine tetraphosphate (Ap4A) HIT family hydrolase